MVTDDRSRPLGWYPWYVASVLALAQIMAGLDRYLMSVVLEPVKADLRLTDSELGMLTGTSFALIFCVASVPLGRLADIANRRLIIACGIAAWSMATIACGFAHSFWQLFIARLGIGLGEAALLPAAVSLLASYFPRDKLTKGISVFTSGNSLGRAVAFLGGGAVLVVLIGHGPIAVPGMRPFQPWQSLMLIAGALGLAVAAACLTIREPVRHGDAREESRKFALSVHYFWQHRGVYLRLFALYGLVVGNSMSLSTWTISLYVRNFGMTVSDASLIVGTISLIVGPIANFFGGWVTDHLEVRRVRAPAMLITAAILATTPVFGLMFWFLPSLGFAIAAYMLVYFIGVAASPPCMAGIQMVTPDRHRGVVASFYVGVYSFIGFGLSPLLVGVLNDFLFRSAQAIHLSLTVSFLVAAIVGVPIALSGRGAYQKLSETFHSKGAM